MIAAGETGHGVALYVCIAEPVTLGGPRGRISQERQYFICAKLSAVVFSQPNYFQLRQLAELIRQSRNVARDNGLFLSFPAPAPPGAAVNYILVLRI
ncbi:hypothetical protein EVAR_19474_1 [Eumeta japonica]|uniref:Uncharacterized protein n=1 Tax=Eumeta variegata TaxID=151549 RepID=A0A4C1VBB9_EUMVA|nr:hypothetical protein EVAR_19474_1 [Eumeta japonica]